ncbi:germination protein YpeB [Bacillus carboniphilus]|uniref:Germination protein YpeB n=1 Tax=Bacillus carboniphilus TaxID=86663 RepID=A0ABY9K1G4_9BACI|nr:germination protein YpeB [Bacillus carboniphilus]WLR43756.1 germination protein YpeB [Bacillus carboniphilus]
MIRGIIITVLSIGVVSTTYWGYKEHQEKNAILINAENNYQRAFHDLTFQIDQLHDQIGTTLAMNSKESLTPGLTEAWRITSQALNDVGQLPLTLMPFDKTEEFLSNIGEFCYRTAVRDLSKDPLSEEEYVQLNELYENAKEIQDELRQVQNTVLNENLRWMDVELALAESNTQETNSIIDGFQAVEKNVEGYSENNFGVTMTSLQNQKKGFENLKGSLIDEKQAKEVVKKFVKDVNSNDMEVTESGEGSDFPFYSITINNQEDGQEIYVDITKQGGHPIYVLNNREVDQKKLSLNEGANKALDFLKRHSFKSFDLFESSQYDNVGVFSFVKKEGEVRIYPEAVRIKVALDNGEVVGFSAKDYLSAQKDRNISKPTIQSDEARKAVNSNLDIQEERLGVIMNDIGEEILCYEFLGTMSSDTFRIYINAENGREEKVERLKGAEQLF